MLKQTNNKTSSTLVITTEKCSFVISLNKIVELKKIKIFAVGKPDLFFPVNVPLSLEYLYIYIHIFLFLYHCDFRL